MSDVQPGLIIECSPSGRGAATLMAKISGDVVAVESIKLSSSKARDGFAAAICKDRPGVDRKAVGAELLKIAADIATKTPAADDSATEIDAAEIVRPERFITPEVSGLAVPSMTHCGGKLVGRWLLYLRWADGKREVRPMAPALEQSDGRQLFIYPEPTEPNANTKPGWSAAARRRWLQGESAPDAAELFASMAASFARFLNLPSQHAPGITATAVLWSMLTYFYQVFPAIPYLFIGGPLGSGKSRFFEVLSRLVFRPLSSSNMTGAALFRTIHGQGGVLLLDEAERLKNVNDPATAEILSMLLAGYKRGGVATRLEPVGDSGFKTLSFDVYGPKALACIAGLPPALASRCITTTMFRATKDSEKPKQRIDADPAFWQRLRDNLHAFAMEHGQTWLELPNQTNVCSGMGGRDYELFQPIASLAQYIESRGARGLLRIIQDYAAEIIDAGRDDTAPDSDETLLRLLAERRRNLELPQPKEILDAARELDNASFRQWTAKGVANMLRRYGVRTDTLHGRKVYRTDIADLLRIQATYGLCLGIEETQVHPG